jgi:AraC family transcriptional regulator
MTPTGGPGMTGPFQTLPAFAESEPTLRAVLGSEQLHLARITRRSGTDPLAITSPIEDAFALVFQLRPLPAHTLWQDGCRVDVPAGPSNALSVIDLAGQVGARIDDPFDSLHFRIPRAALDMFADAAGHRRVSRLHVPGVPFAATDPVIGSLSPALVGALGSSDSSPLFADHLLMTLMAHVAGHYGDGRYAASRTRGGLSPWQERRAKAMLEAGHGHARSLAEVADACGVSLPHFARAFKASAGVSPWKWHQASRLDLARDLLRDGSRSLSDIAGMAGFADQSHFTRVFTARHGISPGQWRREHRID